MSALPCISDYRPGDEFGTGPHAIEELYSLDDAMADAEVMVDREPAMVTQWLCDQVQTTGAVDIGAAADRLDAGRTLTVPQLLALAWCDDKRALRALAALREIYRQDAEVASETAARAAQLHRQENPGLDLEEPLPWN